MVKRYLPPTIVPVCLEFEYYVIYAADGRNRKNTQATAVLPEGKEMILENDRENIRSLCTEK